MLRTALNTPNEFTVTYELVPRQGFDGKRVNRLLDFSKQAKADGRIKALSITDNPGGNPALAPVAIGAEILKIGIEPLIHLSLKDKNRNQVGSHIYLYQRLKLRSLLVLGGDFPNPGYYGQGKPVYDLDTFQALQLLKDMENGCYPDRSGAKHEQYPTPTLFKGCVVSPFKRDEAEQVWQYVKLLHKIKAGADFIVTQVGFDMRKFEELMRFLQQEAVVLPVLANVFIPSLSVARALAAGKIPGVMFAEELVARMEKEAVAGAARARLDRAAGMIARLKRCGYQGVHLGGNNLQFEDISYVLDRFEELNGEAVLPDLDCDFPLKNTWYFYTKKQDGVGNTCIDEVPVPLRPGRRPGASKKHAFIHYLFFTEATFIGRLFARFCLFCSKKPYRVDMLLWIEKTAKRLLFNCQMCGDCTLSHTAFLCPQWNCPKRLINGPCGGSRKGYCEVFPDRVCLWVRVYNRLDPRTTLDTLSRHLPLPPKDW
ncbi:MAG: hypothetical protein D3924_02160, partial [Candidatus Electrothrix sp. AR4]|nr:hypothetical protein [Candidatus Electrothrix sp. AR4]